MKVKTKWGRIYKKAGRWGEEIVLYPIDGIDDKVLIYSEREVEEQINNGIFKKIYDNGEDWR